MYSDLIGLECIGDALESMKLTLLVKIYGIRQANGIFIFDVLSALWALSLNLKHQSFIIFDAAQLSEL